MNIVFLIWCATGTWRGEVFYLLELRWNDLRSNNLRLLPDAAHLCYAGLHLQVFRERHHPHTARCRWRLPQLMLCKHYTHQDIKKLLSSTVAAAEEAAELRQWDAESIWAPSTAPTRRRWRASCSGDANRHRGPSVMPPLPPAQAPVKPPS